MEFFSSVFQILTDLFLNSEMGIVIVSFLIALTFALNYSLGTRVMGYLFNQNPSDNHQLVEFDEEYDHPEYDKSFFTELYRDMQSPINIDPQRTKTKDIFERLRWAGYKRLPKTLILKNTGNTVVLQAEFDRDGPYLSGANLRTHYDFVELTFKWGWQNIDGSEHMLNFNKFSLELQALHRSGPLMHDGEIGYDMITVAYFFDKSLEDNVYLNPICQNIHYIQQPLTQVHIKPFPLDHLIYPFHSGFYRYYGTISDYPETGYTNWFIYPDQFDISARQLQQFRQLKRLDGHPMIKTSRLLKPLGQRDVTFFCFNPEEEDVF